MATVRLSVESEHDLEAITAYTLEKWGMHQASQYLAKFEGAFDLILKTPLIGRLCNDLRPGLRRFQVGSHIVFYFAEQDGIFVLRVLHQSMLPDHYID